MSHTASYPSSVPLRYTHCSLLSCFLFALLLLWVSVLRCFFLKHFFLLFFGIQYIYISDVRNKRNLYIQWFFFLSPWVKKFRPSFIFTPSLFIPLSSSPHLFPPCCPLPHFFGPLLSPTTVPHPPAPPRRPVVFAFFVDSCAERIRRSS